MVMEQDHWVEVAIQDGDWALVVVVRPRGLSPVSVAGEMAAVMVGACGAGAVAEDCAGQVATASAMGAAWIPLREVTFGVKPTSRKQRNIRA